MKAIIHKINICGQRIMPVVAFMLLMAVGSVSSYAGNETTVRFYDPQGINITDVQEGSVIYSRIKWGNLTRSSEETAPELPVEIIRFLVPTFCNDFNVNIAVKDETLVINLDNDVYPVQRDISTNETTFEFKHLNPEVYADNRWNIHAEVLEDGFVDGYKHVVTVAIYPMAYDFSSRKLSVASEIEVSLDYNECDASGLTSLPIFHPDSPIQINVDELVVNPNAGYYKTKRRANIEQATVNPRYYIITPENLKEAVADLATWKRQKGYDVVVKTIEDVYEEYPVGSTHHCKPNEKDDHDVQIQDSAVSLRTYLQDEFYKYGAYYCILMGDWRTPMPIRKFLGLYDKNDSNLIVHDNFEYAIPSDTYFSDLTRKYTLQQDSLLTIKTINLSSCYYTPSIYVGRVLCSTEKEVSNFIEKLIIYESNPGFGDDDYLGKALFFEQCQITENDDKNIHTHSTCLIGETKEIRGNMPTSLDITLYQDPFHEIASNRKDLDQPSSNYPFEDCRTIIPSSEYTSTFLVADMKNYGYHCWMGHGSPYGIQFSQYGEIVFAKESLIGKDPYHNMHRSPKSGLDNMNNVNYPSFLYSNSCTVSPFDKFSYDKVNHFTTNVGRSYTTEGLYGGPNAILNSRLGWVFPGNQIYVKFIKEICKSNNIGVAIANARSLSGSNYSRAACNLFGDPETSIWLAKPLRINPVFTYDKKSITLQGLNVSGLNMIYGYEGNYNNIDVSGGACVFTQPNEMLVSIWKSDYLPVLKLLATFGELDGQSRRYIVEECVLGNPNNTEEKTISSFNVRNGAMLNVSATSPLTINRGFNIVDNSEVHVDTKQDVSITGIEIWDSAKLYVSTPENITINSAFTINDQSVVSLESNKTVTLGKGILYDGATLTVKAKEVKILPGFIVDKGGKLNIIKY